MNFLELNIVLFKNEEESKNKVKIMHLSENRYGGIGIKNIKVHTCKNQKTIEPIDNRKLSIEFIGD